MPHIPGHRMPIGAERDYLEYQAQSEPATQQTSQSATQETSQTATVNPYEYYQEFTSTTPTYDTEQAYSDIGISPTLSFLGQTDPVTGLSYADLIPEYDPYNEEMLRTQFRSGVQEGYQGAVGQLGGIMGQARQQSAQAGFSGSGAIQSAVDTSRMGLQNQYGSAFSDALLSLTSGIRGERLGYQESISDLLTRFQEETPDQNILTTQTIEEQEAEISPLQSAITTFDGNTKDFSMFTDYPLNNVIHKWNAELGRYMPDFPTSFTFDPSYSTGG